MSNMIILGVFIFLSIFPNQVMATTYGGDNYGESQYSPTGTTTTSTSSNSSGSSGGSSGSTNCTDQPLTSAPNLFQIDRYADRATLYFTPASKPYAGYYVAYGFKENEERFGVQFAIGYVNGAITYTINSLNPKTTYYFKVRAGNGCATGPWSGNIQAGSLSNSTTKSTFYPQNSTVSQKVYQFAVGKNILQKKKATNTEQSKPKQGKPVSKKAVIPAPQPENFNIFNTITNFFLNIQTWAINQT